MPVYTPGFDGDIMVATNVDFALPTGTAQKMLTIGGQLMIATGNVFPLQEIAAGFVTAGPGISIAYVGGNIEITNIVPPSPFVLTPDTGVNIVNTVFNFNGFGGLETFGFSPTDLQIQDRRWLSAFVVDPSVVFGSEAEYTTVQAAITAATAPAVVYVRANAAPYVENLTFKAGIDVIGIETDGRDNAPAVEIQGNHTFSGNGTCIVQNVLLHALAGDTVTIAPVAPDTSAFAVKNCTVLSDVGRSIRCSPAVTATAIFTSFDSDLVSDQVTIHLTNSCFVTVDGGLLNSVTSSATRTNATQTLIFNLVEITSSAACFLYSGTGESITATHCNLTSTVDEIVAFGASTGTYQGSNNIMTCDSGTGFYITGTGTYTYSDETIKGTATAIDPTVTQVIDVWRPYALSGAAPGTGVARGNAAFDAAQFLVTNGFVQNIGGGPGITTLSADDATTTTGTTILLQGIAGIETGNAGAGVIEISNKRFISPYIVDPSAVFGTRGEYTTIQAAITAAFGAGGGSVVIRQNTSPYVENLTLQPGVDLIGVSADGRVGSLASLVSIQGSHTMVANGNVAMSNIEFLGDGASQVFNLIPVATTSTLTLTDCLISDVFGGINISAGAAGTAEVNLYGCITDCAGAFSMNGVGTNVLYVKGGRHTSSGSDCLQTAAGDCTATFEECFLSGTNFGIQLASTGTQIINLTNATLECLTSEAIQASFAASVNIYHSTIKTNSATTNFITGPITLRHIDLALTGSAINNNAATTVYEDWKPYGLAGAAPGTGVFRGTACYDVAQFNVTNGFVQLVGGSGPAASTFPVDNGGPGVPLVGSLSILGSTSVDFPNPSGIETHVGATTNEIYFEDRRWITAFVVDPNATVGLRGTFTTIQAAIIAAGAGPADIYIRPGTYTENIALNGNVYLIATDMSGTLSPPALNSAHVNVIGDHVVNQNGLTVCKGIFFTSTTTGFLLEDTATAGVAKLECINCFFNAGGEGFILGGAVGTGQLRLINCQSISVGRNIVIPTGSLGGFYQLFDADIISGGDACVYIDSMFAEGDVKDCILSGGGSSPFYFDLNSAGATLDLSFSRLTAPTVACITFQAAASVFSYHNTYDPAGNSEYITGPGLYFYCDDVILGGKLSSGIDGAAVQNIAGWRPWAEADVNGTTVVRGTAAFDSAFFTVTEGWVTMSAGAGILTLTANDATVASGANILLNGIAGIETGNAGAGTIDISNKRFYSQYVVDPSVVFGSRGEYSTIQAAITAAFAAGGGEVLIRPGTYLENLTFEAGVDLIGAEVDGRLPSFLSKVVISGNHTFTGAGGFGVVISKDINFTCATGDLLTMTATAGGQLICAFKFCGLEATTDPASRLIVFNPDATSACQFSTDNTNIGSASHTFEMIGAGSGAALISLGSVNSSAGDLFRLTSGSGSLSGSYTSLAAGQYVFNGISSSGQCTFDHANIFAVLEAVIFPAAGGQCTATHATITSGAVSGFWIDGTGGQVSFGDILLTGSAQDIGAAVTQVKLNWQPYAETAAAAVGSIRGTSSYDVTQFLVTDGFVQLTALATGITALTADDATSTTGSTILINGLGGIETANAGAGFIQVSDKRFLSEFVVDLSTTFGTRGEYSTIQAAYNAADAAGGGTIYIRSNPTASYTEDLSLTSNTTINFVGANGDSTNSLNLVILAGTATVTGTGMHTFTNMQILGVVDSPFNMTSAGAMNFEFQNCSVSTFANNALNQPAGTLQLKAVNSTFTGVIDTCRFDGTSIQAEFTDCLIGSTTNSPVEMTTAGTAAFSNCRFVGANFGLNVNSGAVDLTDCSVQATNECLNLAGGSSARLFNVKLFTSAVSGFTITGTGQLIYDSIVSEANVTLDPALALQPLDWQPYAQDATAPALPAAGQGLRGTACFDDTQFLVTKGFVQLIGGSGSAANSFPTDSGTATPAAGVLNVIGGPGVTTEGSGSTVTVNAIKMTRTGASTTIIANQGVIVTAAATVQSTPTTGLELGTKIRVVNSQSGLVTIQAQGASTLRYGIDVSSSNGTWFSSEIGAVFEMMYDDVDNIWYVVSAVGNWNFT